jgi:hypothetical protein
MEFAACKACNEATRDDELVAATLVRLWPDVPETEEEQFRKLAASAEARNPGLLQELEPSLRQSKEVRRVLSSLGEKGHAVNLSGPVVGNAMERFAAKLGYALHYELTGEIISRDGGTRGQFFTNVEVANGALPEGLVSHVGEPMTLVQGAWNVGEQFRYRIATTADKGASIALVSFRQSISVVTFASQDAARLKTPDGSSGLILPGQWKKNPKEDAP